MFGLNMNLSDDVIVVILIDAVNRKSYGTKFDQLNHIHPKADNSSEMETYDALEQTSSQPGLHGVVATEGTAWSPTARVMVLP